jgi:cytochrome c oxidase subunit 4
MIDDVNQVEPAEEAELAIHPGPRKYVTIAVILAVITIAEVAVYYFEAVRSILVPALVSFAFVKFLLVVSWFMHLRFDSRLFRRLFVTGLVLALAVFTVVLVTFFTHLGGPSPNVTG